MNMDTLIAEYDAALHRDFPMLDATCRRMVFFAARAAVEAIASTYKDLHRLVPDDKSGEVMLDAAARAMPWVLAHALATIPKPSEADKALADLADLASKFEKALDGFGAAINAAPAPVAPQTSPA